MFDLCHSWFCIYIGLGVFILIPSLFKVFSTFTLLKRFELPQLKKIAVFFQAHLALVFFFIPGYIFFAFTLHSNSNKIAMATELAGGGHSAHSPHLMAAIFLGGAVFVYLSSALQNRMIHIIHKSYSQIEEQVNERTAKLKEERDHSKKLVSNLEEKNRVMGGYNHMIAHDLKNPLSAIKGYLDLLHNREKMALDNIIQNQMLTKSNNIIVQMIDTINKMLFFASWDSKLTLSQNTVQPIVEHSINMLQDQIDKSQADIKTDFKVKTLMCDRTLMIQVISNLVSNSLKYSKQDEIPVIKISTTPADNNQTAFSIQDNGIGIRKEKLSSVFQEFSRVHEEKIIAKGHGIGLATCCKIIDAHHGNISVESEFGKGSTFTVMIPNQAVTS